MTEPILLMGKVWSLLCGCMGAVVCLQLPASEVKKIQGPPTPDGPLTVPGQFSLTQELIPQGPPVNEKAVTRGF